MASIFRLLSVTMIFVAGQCTISRAADEPNFLAMGIPPEIFIFESADLRNLLHLSDDQREQLQSGILKEAKASFLDAKTQYDARPSSQRRGPYMQRRNNRLKNVISDQLDDRQHQLFHRMLTLIYQSPVNSNGAFRFDLQLSEDQLEHLRDLETQWIKHALDQVNCDFQYQRHTEERDFSKYGGLLKYGKEVARAAWVFTSKRDEQWSQILTPEQAKQWKQRELQSIFPIKKFDVLLIDFQPARDGRELLDTKTWMDMNVPYLTPPREALGWSEQQFKEVQELAQSVRFDWSALPSAPEARASLIAERQQQEVKCLQKLEKIMTEKQRAIFWDLFGEPTPGNRYLHELKAKAQLDSSESNSQKD